MRIEAGVFGALNVLVQPEIGFFHVNVRREAGGGFQPIVEILARPTAVLLVEMKSVRTDIFLSWHGDLALVGAILVRGQRVARGMILFLHV